VRQRLAHLIRRLADRLDPPAVPEVVVTWTSWSPGWGTAQPYEPNQIGPNQPTITFQ
jgi:hypothetical protein